MESFNLFMYKTEETEEPLRESIFDAHHYRLTKKEMEKIQEEFRRQKKVFEKENKIFMSEERKKALYG